MSPTSREILSQALALPPVERAELIEELLASFGFPDREGIDSRWAAEAEDRIDAYERGDLKARPSREVYARIESGETSELDRWRSSSWVR